MDEAASESLQIFACHSCQKRLKYPLNLAGKRVKCPRCQSLVSLPPLTPFDLEQAASLRIQDVQMPRSERFARWLVGEAVASAYKLWKIRGLLVAIAIVGALLFLSWTAATNQAKRAPLTPEQIEHDRLAKRAEDLEARRVAMLKVVGQLDDAKQRYEAWRTSLPDMRYLVNRQEASDFYAERLGIGTTAYDFCMQGYDEFTKSKDAGLQESITKQKNKFLSELTEIQLELTKFEE